MHCFEYEMLRMALARRLAELGASAPRDDLKLADLLAAHDVTSVEQLPDLGEVARAGLPGEQLAA